MPVQVSNLEFCTNWVKKCLESMVCPKCGDELTFSASVCPQGILYCSRCGVISLVGQPIIDVTTHLAFKVLRERWTTKQ